MLEDEIELWLPHELPADVPRERAALAKGKGILGLEYPAGVSGRAVGLCLFHLLVLESGVRFQVEVEVGRLGDPGWRPSLQGTGGVVELGIFHMSGHEL